MAKNIQSVRGMNDILPVETSYWQYVENTLREVALSYGYQEIRFPLLERTELFVRTIGEVTDIVEKEMYTFKDKNDDSLTLRPEGTAGCVRAGVQHGLLHNQIQRLWYMGPMFRHERPQKGRFRQFHQFGAEVFGLKGPDLDAELLLLSARFWDALQIKDKVKLHINTLGTAASRIHYRQELTAYLTANFELLDEESKHRLPTNPLRILDSKNHELRDLITKAPKLLDFLSEEDKQHFTALLGMLDALEIEYVVDPCLVRGLDYYCVPVFEWITTELGSQGAVCAGGRYDGLVEELGGRTTPAIGFALGLERLIELIKDKNCPSNSVHAYLVLLGDAAVTRGFALAEKMRREILGLRLITNCGDGNMSTQMKRADKSGARVALIIGDDELEREVVTIKYLREDKPQKQVNYGDLNIELTMLV
jgi:histidyl-tRNA synthetase